MERNLLDINNDNTNIDKELQQYLLQINRIKLIDYIQCGLVAPDRYLSDECEKDIQSRNPSFLILSDGYLQELDESQILIELILTDDEKEKLYTINDVCYLNIPLPISRIKKVYVHDKQIVKHMKVQIENSDSGYLPDEIFDVYKKRTNIFELKTYAALLEEIVATDYQEEIRKYDKRLGMFSFMKNTNLYYADTTQTISNYSDHYISALSLLLKDRLEDKSFELTNIINENIHFKELLYSDKQIDKEFLSNIAESIKEVELREIFLNLQKPTNERQTLLQLYEKRALNLYLIGLVYHFRQKTANKKDSFKIEIDTLIPKDVAEISLAILGLYLGYKNIRASERVDIKDKLFNTLYGGKVAMKFMMQSKLDYITIETIYNVSFKIDHKGCEYEYLTYPKEKKSTLKLPTDKNTKRWYEVVEDKNYFDTKVMKIKKKSFETIVEQQFEKLPEKLTSSKEGILIGYILKHFSQIISPVKFGETLQISCEKNDLINAIKSCEKESKKDLLLDLIELNGKL